jgi:hypothetical protein
MTLHVFMHLRSKRAKTIALLDSDAIENFMSLEYAKYLPTYPSKHFYNQESCSMWIEPKTEQVT